MFNDFIQLVRDIYKNQAVIPLHAPVFKGNEKKYVIDCIDSTYVSSVGEYVTRFENEFAKFVGVNHAVATVNGTAALHIALKLCGVRSGDEVITQPLTFVATCNAIKYCDAEPVFVDVDKARMSLSSAALAEFLQSFAKVRDEVCYNKKTGRIIRACVVMHTFGHAADIVNLKQICDQYRIKLIEDAAEAVGSYYEGRHLGGFADVGVFSFNGNKILTTGGGGMIVTHNSEVAKKAKHLTTTAKVPHAWEFMHDEIGYNYRMPNINAALGCAQLETLADVLLAKRNIADTYAKFFADTEIQFMLEPSNATSNYWLNALILKDQDQRNQFLEHTNASNIMTRPIWGLMNHLPMYCHCFSSSLGNAEWLQNSVVNIPSGANL